MTMLRPSAAKNSSNGASSPSTYRPATKSKGINKCWLPVLLGTFAIILVVYLFFNNAETTPTPNEYVKLVDPNPPGQKSYVSGVLITEEGYLPIPVSNDPIRDKFVMHYRTAGTHQPYFFLVRNLLC